jgi:hypothetical protein
MICPHCEELLSSYQQEVVDFADLTKRLTAAVRSGERDLIAQVLQQTRESRLHCQSARELILLHFKGHKS